MRKFSTVIILLLILNVTVFGCAKKADPIELPPINNILSIEIPGGIEDTIVTDKGKIVAFFEKVKDAKPTSKLSVQDVPMVDHYTRVDLVGEGVFISIFIYQENSKWYIEKPYVGIYETDETIMKILRE